MILFIILILIEFILYLLLLNRRKNYKMFIIMSFIIFILISGFRNIRIGRDTITYYNFFCKIINSRFMNLNIPSSFEEGFIIYSYLLNIFSNNPKFMIFMTSFITLGLIGVFIYKNSDNLFMSIILFVCFRFYFESMNTMREFLAVAIILYGFKYIKEKNFLKYLFFVLIATSIHYSAILSIILYFLFNNISKKNITKLEIIIFLMSIIFYINIGQILNIIFKIFPKYASYISRLNSFKLANIISTFIYLLIFMFIKVLNKDKEKSTLFLETIMLLSFGISLLSIKMNIISRILYYYSMFSIIAIPNSLLLIKDKNSRFLLKLIIYILIILYFVVVGIYRPEWIYVNNYSFNF